MYNEVLTGGGIYSVRAAGTGLFGLIIRVLVGTNVFRVDQGVFNILAFMRSKVRMGQRLAITFEQFDS